MAKTLNDLFGADLDNIDQLAALTQDAVAKTAAANLAVAAAKAKQEERATSDRTVTSSLQVGHVYTTPRSGVFAILVNGDVQYVTPDDAGAITVPDPEPAPAPAPAPAS